MNATSKRRVTALVSGAVSLVVVACTLVVCIGRGCLTGATGVESAATVSPIPSNRDAYVPGELIIGLDDAGNTDGVLVGKVTSAVSGAGFGIDSTLSQATDKEGSILLVSTGEGFRFGSELEQAAREIARIAGIRYVQPNYRYVSQDAKATDLAKDRDVSRQWYLNSWADGNGADVASAWSKVGSSSKVDVAVFDTGVYVMQESDSQGRAVTSPENYHQEFNAYNLDVTKGFDFVHSADNSDPIPLVNDKNPYGDDNGHGTHVSAIIAASASTAQTPGNEARGMAGVSQNARIIPMKVLDASGEGDTSDFISAYAYLAENAGSGKLFPNLHVVNLSLSLTLEDDDDDEAEDDIDDGEGIYDGEEEGEVIIEEQDPSKTNNVALESKIKEAYDKGIVTVCAAGNEGSAAPTYPSDQEECVSVTALNREGKVTAFSNLNKEKDISAPGVDIYSAWGSQADAYATFSGTSQAAAIVSGAFSMLWAASPSLSVDAAKKAVYETAKPVVGYEERSGLQASAMASGGLSGPGLAALGVQGMEDGSHGAIDVAAAIAYVTGSAQGGGDERGSSSEAAPSESAGTGENTGADEGEGASTNPNPGSSPSPNPTQSSTSTPDPSPAPTPDPNPTPDPGAGSNTGESSSSSSGESGSSSSASYDGSSSSARSSSELLAEPTKSLDGATLVFLGDAVLDGTPDEGSYRYKGQPVEPKPVVYDADLKEVPEFDSMTKMRNWSIKYIDNGRPGIATAIVTGKGAYEGTASEEFTIVGAGDGGAPTTVPLSEVKIALEDKSSTYTGKKLKPAILATYGSRSLKKGEDFTAKYSNNKLPGTARVTVTGKGSYEGAVTLTFKIALGKTKLTKLTKGKAAFTASWKRVKSGGVGYQVRYSLKKNMKGAKIKSVKKNATTKLKVGKLQRGKKYYAQIRTFKEVGKKTYRSSWSARKAVRVK